MIQIQIAFQLLNLFNNIQKIQVMIHFLLAINLWLAVGLKQQIVQHQKMVIYDLFIIWISDGLTIECIFNQSPESSISN